MTDPKTKGEISEHICKAELVKRGVTVLEPSVENVRYDFVAEEDGEFYRLQCKTASKRDDKIRFEVRSSQHNNTGGKRKDYKGEIDFFIIYSPDEDSVYLVPIEETGKSAKTLRLEPTKNNQSTGVSMAEDYTLDKVFGNELI